MNLEHEQLKLLPDNGLPMEDEVERNIENLVEETKAELLPAWEQNNVAEKNREDFCQQMRRVFIENFGSMYRAEIERRRKNEAH